MNKILCASQNMLMFASLVALDSFHVVLSTQLTADLTPGWNGGSKFHPLSYIYSKTPFCCTETVANNSLNHRHIVVVNWLWANITPTLSTAFSLTNIHEKWWINCLLISSPLLSHATSIYERAKQVCGVFLVFSKTTAKFGQPEHSALFVSIRLHLKSAYHLLTVVSDGAASE